MYISTLIFLAVSAYMPATLADGGYLGSCNNLRAYAGDANHRGLNADCRNAAGTYVDTSINVANCYTNNNGVIGCSGPG